MNEPSQAYPYVKPSGNVVAVSALGCPGPPSSANTLQEVTPSGASVWQLSTDACAPQPYSSLQPVFDGAGNSYILTNAGVKSVDAAGHLRWETSAALVGSATRLALGWDGFLYAGGRDAQGGTAGVERIDTATGAQSAFAPGLDVTGLYAYSGGVIIDQDSQQVDYYAYDGSHIPSIETSAAVRGGSGYSSANGGNGRIFEAGFPTYSGIDKPSVDLVTPGGVQWTWTGPDAIGGQTFVAAAPDGGVILLVNKTVWSIDSTGKTRWTFSPTPPSNGTIQFVSPPIVDDVGHVIIPYNYNYPPPTGHSISPLGVAADILSQTSSTPALPSTNVQQSSCGDPEADTELPGYGAVAVGPGQIYFGLQEGWCPPYPSSVQAFSAPGLGADYRLTTDYGTVTPPPPPEDHLTLTAQPTRADLGSSVTLTATLRDSQGQPVSGKLVTFNVTSGPGVGRFAAKVATGDDGAAGTTFSSQRPGRSTVVAWVDKNINGVVDANEPTSTTKVAWGVRQGPVLLVHGIDAVSASSNCAATWDDAKSYLRTHDYADRDLVTLSYYKGDTNCDRTISRSKESSLGNNYFESGDSHAKNSDGHTANAPIEHLAYHLAWFIFDNYTIKGRSVDILAHSMGGLITRYALAKVQSHDLAFPPALFVGNVVTFATPNGGAKVARIVQCAVLANYECDEMKAGSDFLTDLQTIAWNPQGDGGTDWSAIGSDGDKSVAADRATGTSRNRLQNLYFGGCHKYWYLKITKRVGRAIQVVQNIDHSEYMHDGTVPGGMTATSLETYSSSGHCGAPLVHQTGQLHPMALAALALSSKDY